MIRGVFLEGKSNLSECLKIRKAVYVDELNLSEKQAFDMWDEYAVNALAFDGDRPVGTGRILFDGKNYRISFVAVLKDERRKGYGDFIVRMLSDRAFVHGAKIVEADIDEDKMMFLKKIGYEVVSVSDGLAKTELTEQRFRGCTPCKKNK